MGRCPAIAGDDGLRAQFRQLRRLQIALNHDILALGRYIFHSEIIKQKGVLIRKTLTRIDRSEEAWAPPLIDAVWILRNTYI